MTNPKIFNKSVTTAGTPVQLTAQTVDPGQTVTVKAKTGNTGSVYVGDSFAHALSSSGSNVELIQGQSATFNVSEVSQLWLDAANNGDGVEIIVA